MRKSKYNSFDELPLMLTVEDVSHVLGIGLAHAYEVCLLYTSTSSLSSVRMLPAWVTTTPRRGEISFEPTATILRRQ